MMEEDICKFGTCVQSHVGLRTVDGDRQHCMCQILFIPVRIDLLYPAHIKVNVELYLLRTE